MDYYLDEILNELWDTDVEAAGGRRINLVRARLASGIVPPASAILMTSYECRNDILQLLLRAGGSANARHHLAKLDDIEIDLNMLNDVTINIDTLDIAQAIQADSREWYAILFVALTPLGVATGSTRIADTIAALLKHGADIYATYTQPIRRAFPYPFPGEDHDPMFSLSAWEDHAVDLSIRNTQTASPNLTQMLPMAGYVKCCIIHSIIECGGWAEPFFAHGIDLEYLDPLGRTILHATCRSQLGADTEYTSSRKERASDRELYVAMLEDRPSVVEGCSLFEKVLSMGAEPLARDHSGRNILHHLLEARSDWTPDLFLPPISRALQWSLEHHPQLMHQPTVTGNYPLHSALQRMCQYKIARRIRSYRRGELEVIALLEAGCDAKAVDSRGNTALHYLAEGGLTIPLQGDGLRELLRRFCHADIDVNKRNLHGRTAIELIFMMDYQLVMHRFSTSGPSSREQPFPQKEVDFVVLETLSSAGADWHAVTADTKQSLLHLASVQDIDSSLFRVQWLAGKGVDVLAKDGQGKTAADLAQALNRSEIVDYLHSRALNKLDTAQLHDCEGRSIESEREDEVEDAKYNIARGCSTRSVLLEQAAEASTSSDNHQCTYA